MTVKLVIMAAVCLFIAVQSFGQTKYKSAEIYELSRQIEEKSKDKIWTGFDMRRYTKLKTGDAEAGDFIYFSNEPDNPEKQNFYWRVTDDYFLTHALEEDLVITFHEAFHAFEADAARKGKKWGAENALLVFEYQESSARAGALFAVESRILRAALEAENRSALKERAREFLAIRALRQGELEPRFVEFEKGAEQNEGLAEYAGTKAVLLGIDAARQKRLSIPFTEREGSAFLQKKYRILDAVTSVGKNVRRRFYYTGSAQGFLLDRLTRDWKTKVQMEGTAVQELLAQAVGKPLFGKSTEEILARYGYEKILAEEEKAVAERRAANRALLEKTLAQAGRTYVIDFSALGAPAGIRNFDPMNVTLVSPKLRVHTRSVSFAGGASFTAQFSQPVVEDLENKRYSTVVPNNESETITVDGIVLDLTKPAEIDFNKSLSISSSNFEFKAVKGKIKIENGKVEVRVLDSVR